MFGKGGLSLGNVRCRLESNWESSICCSVASNKSRCASRLAINEVGDDSDGREKTERKTERVERSMAATLEVPDVYFEQKI